MSDCRMVRFDVPCTALRGAVEYFRDHLRVGDYLAEQGAAEMTWGGRGADMLGLSGACDLEAFSRLCLGEHPATGAKLLIREKSGRRLCYFGQISAPKDVSIAYLVGGDLRIAAWWKEAVAETLREIEACAATRVRRAAANEDRTTGNMIAAIVTHDASRALDPQLHTHVCIINLTHDAGEQRWKGMQPSGFYRHPGYFREVCYNRLAASMLAGGYTLEPARRTGFNLTGFPPELRERFSKRRADILRRAQEEGVSSQAALQKITSLSRAQKTKARAAELRAGWIAECGGHLERIQKVIAQSTPRKIPGLESGLVMASAEAHVFERRSVVDHHVLLREALGTGRGHVSLAELRTALATRVGDGRLLAHGDLVGSPSALAAEKEFIGWVESQRTTCRPLGLPPAGPKIDPHQQRVVTGMLESNARVVILQGDAGTGKTTCLRPVLAGITAGGSDVFGCAPSSGATEILRRELVAEADTLQQLLVNESLQAKIRGRVIVVDEAGLMSSRQMRDLCRLAAANDNRLLLVGDTKQHSSIEAGDALRCLQQYANAPIFSLTKIRRQKDPAYRDAVSLLAAGNARAAFAAFERLGAVREVSDSRSLFRLAAEDYVRTLRAGESCLAISPVWSEIHDFNAEVRARLRACDMISGPDHNVATIVPLQWTREQKRRVENYQPDDVLIFHRAVAPFAKGEILTVTGRRAHFLQVRHANQKKHELDPATTSGFEVGAIRQIPIATGDRLLLRANHRETKLRNGELVDVRSLESDHRILLQDGRILPLNFRQFAHGYAVTSHASQGKTVDRGILLMADAGIAAGNLKQAYVSNSRFRESQMIYTTDRSAARDAMSRADDRMLAFDLGLALQPSSRVAFLANLYRTGAPNGAAMLHGRAAQPPDIPSTIATGTFG